MWAGICLESCMEFEYHNVSKRLGELGHPQQTFGVAFLESLGTKEKSSKPVRAQRGASPSQLWVERKQGSQCVLERPQTLCLSKPIPSQLAKTRAPCVMYFLGYD